MNFIIVILFIHLIIKIIAAYKPAIKEKKETYEEVKHPAEFQLRW